MDHWHIGRLFVSVDCDVADLYLQTKRNYVKAAYLGTPACDALDLLHHAAMNVLLKGICRGVPQPYEYGEEEDCDGD
jgi:hypothetical protein